MDKGDWTSMFVLGFFHYELDWIAIDNFGHLGVFTALLGVPVPKEVAKSFEYYMELNSRIEALQMTSKAVKVTSFDKHDEDWIKYAKKGLFAFDFSDVHRENNEKLNQYDLLYKPSKPLHLPDIELPQEIVSIIPIINCDFRDGDIPFEKINPKLDYPPSSAPQKDVSIEYLFSCPRSYFEKSNMN